MNWMGKSLFILVFIIAMGCSCTEKQSSSTSEPLSSTYITDEATCLSSNGIPATAGNSNSNYCVYLGKNGVIDLADPSLTDLSITAYRGNVHHHECAIRFSIKAKSGLMPTPVVDFSIYNDTNADGIPELQNVTIDLKQDDLFLADPAWNKIVYQIVEGSGVLTLGDSTFEGVSCIDPQATCASNGHTKIGHIKGHLKFDIKYTYDNSGGTYGIIAKKNGQGEITYDNPVDLDIIECYDPPACGQNC